MWAARVADLGIRSVVSARLATRRSVIGAFSVYGREPGCFDADDLAVAAILARHASVALAAAREEDSIWVAIDARKLVGQAQGILMERHDLDQDQAFAVLRHYSEQHNMKLSEVAHALVSRRQLPH